MNLYLDIETIPAQRPEVLQEIRDSEQVALDAAIAEVRAPGNYGAEAAAKWMADKGQAQIEKLQQEFTAKVDEAYRKTGLDGAFGHVAVVSYALDDDEAVTIWREDWKSTAAERELLRELDDSLDRHLRPSEAFSTTVVGHNVAAFDLRFLMQRSIIAGIQPHIVLARAAQAKPWEQDKVYDTMVQWAGIGNRVKLDKLCKVLSIPCKGDIDGSKVWDYVQAGRLREVADYCAADVERVRAVHRRMTFQDMPEAAWGALKAA